MSFNLAKLYRLQVILCCRSPDRGTNSGELFFCSSWPQTVILCHLFETKLKTYNYIFHITVTTQTHCTLNVNSYRFHSKDLPRPCFESGPCLMPDVCDQPRPDSKSCPLQSLYFYVNIVARRLERVPAGNGPQKQRRAEQECVLLHLRRCTALGSNLHQLHSALLFM